MAGGDRKREPKSEIVVVSALKDWNCAECGGGMPRRRRRSREAPRERSRRAEHDLAFQAEMAAEIARLFPGCPRNRADEVARHTGARRSGRVGRSAAGRAFEPGALRLAVAASVRHRDTSYDELLMSGVERAEARSLVREEVEGILESWRASSGWKESESY